jgi:hypothetical protein
MISFFPFFCPRFQKLRVQRYRTARRAFFLARFPCRSRYIQMSPSVFAREARQEAGSGYRAGSASAYVRHVGEVAFQLLLVVVP